MCRGATTRPFTHSAVDLCQWGLPTPFNDNSVVLKQEPQLQDQQASFDPFNNFIGEFSIPEVPHDKMIAEEQPMIMELPATPMFDDICSLFQGLPQAPLYQTNAAPESGVLATSSERVVPQQQVGFDTGLWDSISKELSASPDPTAVQQQPLSPFANPLSPLSPLSNPLSPELSDSSCNEEFLDPLLLCPPVIEEEERKPEIEAKPKVNKKKRGGSGVTRSRKRRIHELDPVQRERARHLNRLSARRHRQVAKKKNQESEQKLENMRSRNADLANEVIKLQAKRDTLLSLVRDMRQ